MLAYASTFAALLLTVAFSVAGVMLMVWARRQIVEFRRELIGLFLVLVGVGLLFYGLFLFFWGSTAFSEYFGIPESAPIPDGVLNITSIIGWLILAVPHGRVAFKGSSLRHPRVSSRRNLAVVIVCLLFALQNAYELI